MKTSPSQSWRKQSHVEVLLLAGNLLPSISYNFILYVLKTSLRVQSKHTMKSTL